MPDNINSDEKRLRDEAIVIADLRAMGGSSAIYRATTDEHLLSLKTFFGVASPRDLTVAIVKAKLLGINDRKAAYIVKYSKAMVGVRKHINDLIDADEIPPNTTEI